MFVDILRFGESPRIPKQRLKTPACFVFSIIDSVDGILRSEKSENIMLYSTPSSSVCMIGVA
jgi:hypothetical protein